MDVKSLLDDAIEHHRLGRPEEAQKGYEAVLAAEPDNVHALSVSAILLSNLGDDAGALRRMEKAIVLDPANAALHNNLGNIHREQDRLKEAYEAYRAAVNLDPRFVDAICNLAIMVRANGMVDDAIAIFNEALAIDPGHVETLHNLGVALVFQNRAEEAADCFERCYADGRIPVIDPSWHAQTLTHLGRQDRALEIMEAQATLRPEDPGVQHYLAALRGELVPRASDDYVRTHFDDFAASFDEVLTHLKYRAPEIVGAIVREMCERGPTGLLYDLGCGTGLAGPEVRTAARTLVGIDLSPKMLERAQRRGVYDKLIVAEITAALNDMPEHSADMAICVDTLIYFGDLAPVWAGLRRALRQGGAFVATIESHADDDPAGGARILSSGRYSHSAAYIRETAAAAGLRVHAIMPVHLRIEHAIPVEGYVLMIENPA